MILQFVLTQFALGLDEQPRDSTPLPPLTVVDDYTLYSGSFSAAVLMRTSSANSWNWNCMELCIWGKSSGTLWHFITGMIERNMPLPFNYATMAVVLMRFHCCDCAYAAVLCNRICRVMQSATSGVRQFSTCCRTTLSSTTSIYHVGYVHCLKKTSECF